MTTTLIKDVTNILYKKVTDEEARYFAVNQYEILKAHIRAELVSEIMEYRKPNEAKQKAINIIGSKSKNKLKIAV